MRSVRMRREIEEQQEAALILDVAQPPIRGSPCSLARPASLGRGRGGGGRHADAGLRNLAAAVQPAAPVVP